MSMPFSLKLSNTADNFPPKRLLFETNLDRFALYFSFFFESFARKPSKSIDSNGIFFNRSAKSAPMRLHARLSDVDWKGILLSLLLLLLLLMLLSPPVSALPSFPSTSLFFRCSNVDAEATTCPSDGRTTRPTTWRLLKNTCKRCNAFIAGATRVKDDDDIVQKSPPY